MKIGVFTCFIYSAIPDICRAIELIVNIYSTSDRICDMINIINFIYLGIHIQYVSLLMKLYSLLFFAALIIRHIRRISPDKGISINSPSILLRPAEPNGGSIKDQRDICYHMEHWIRFDTCNYFVDQICPKALKDEPGSLLIPEFQFLIVKP
jgi:hypothetical protein